MINHSIINLEDQKFLISNTPYENTIYDYIELLKFNKIKHVIRVCSENTYPKYMLEENGFFFLEFKIKDGCVPTLEEKEKWINNYNILKSKGIKNFAIHCVSGLGRAPLFMALALVVNDEFDPYDVITLIRNNRKGSLNSIQVKYIISQKNKQKCNCNLQ